MRCLALIIIGMLACGTVGLAQQDTSRLLTPTEAARHRGQTATVCGLVAKVSCADDGMDLRVDALGASSPFHFHIPKADQHAFDPDLARQLDEQRACATGRIERIKDGHQILVTIPGALTLDSKSPARPPRFGPDVYYGCEPGTTQPKMTRSVQPVYPDRAKGKGTVYGKAVVNTDGTVGEVVLIRGVDPDMDRASLEAIRRFQFTPGTLMGQPVRSVVMFEMEFTRH